MSTHTCSHACTPAKMQDPSLVDVVACSFCHLCLLRDILGHRLSYTILIMLVVVRNVVRVSFEEGSTTVYMFSVSASCVWTLLKAVECLREVWCRDWVFWKRETQLTLKGLRRGCQKLLAESSLSPTSQEQRAQIPAVVEGEGWSGYRVGEN